MIHIGLTGSIGMGKSTVARMFAVRGVRLFDADAVVRRLQAEDREVISAIGAEFPGTVVDGQVDRARLAARVLPDGAALERLEAIMHPRVEAARLRFIEEHPNASALLFDIPLLFEKRREGDFDKVIVVSAGADIQRDRVLARPGIRPATLEWILGRQLPDADKRAQADFVIDTSGELSTTERQVDAILACLGLGTVR